MVLGETISIVRDSFRAYRVRFLLTALGMVMGTASLILVVTVGLTGKQYIISQIQNIGANMIYVEFEGAAERVGQVDADFLTIHDLAAVRQQVSGIQAASPMVALSDAVSTGSGRERDVLILGVSDEYRIVRSLTVLAGRFFDKEDVRMRNKVLVVTQEFARQQYGSEQAAVGSVVRISGLPFTIVGVFKESVETFGQSEINTNSLVMPYTVARYFVNSDRVKQLFFSAANAADVPSITREIEKVVVARHRAESEYKVSNLTELISVADRVANALTIVLLLISTITLAVSGVGIMNIMLASVSSRIREIGVRKAIGATTHDIRFQFLAEAVFISLLGGLIGIAMGLSVPLSLRFLTGYAVPVSGLSVLIALVVSTLVGILFGTVPASRAAHLDPVESLKYE
ncbi:MAG: ABC transporter permease [Candidatus Korobacteraceae bacterium]